MLTSQMDIMAPNVGVRMVMTFWRPNIAVVLQCEQGLRRTTMTKVRIVYNEY